MTFTTRELERLEEAVVSWKAHLRTDMKEKTPYYREVEELRLKVQNGILEGRHEKESRK